MSIARDVSLFENCAGDRLKRMIRMIRFAKGVTFRKVEIEIMLGAFFPAF